MACAVAALQAHRHADPEVAATAVISAWIRERARAVTAPRLGPYLAYDLAGATEKGAIEAILPHVADELTWVDPKTPFWELPKADVVDIFYVGLTHAGQAVVAMTEGAEALGRLVPA